MRTSRAGIEPFTTKDGSIIRELMHPGAQGKASLAEATVSPARATTLHRHHKTEETYHFLSGRGTMRLGEDTFAVEAGDTVLIAPGTPHKLWSDDTEPLVLLCACAPPYSHDDTELLEPEA